MSITQNKNKKLTLFTKNNQQNPKTVAEVEAEKYG